MNVCTRKKDGSFVFSVGKPTHFLFLLSDFSAFGNPAKKPLNIRGNFRKCMKIMLHQELDRLELLLSSDKDFFIGPPILSKKESEPKKLELTITIPPGNAIKVYSIDSGYMTYLVNINESFYETTDVDAVEESTGAYF